MYMYLSSELKQLLLSNSVCIFDTLFYYTIITVIIIPKYKLADKYVHIICFLLPFVDWFDLHELEDSDVD